MTKYAVFIDVTEHYITAHPSDKLSEIRKKHSNWISDDDHFIADIYGEKSVLSLVQERDATVGGTSFPPAGGVTDRIIQIVRDSKGKPSFLGMQPKNNWVTQSTSAKDQNFAVQVVLNKHSDVAIENNKGMFEPLMLINVVSAVPDHPKSFPNVVVCQKGAIIQFNIRSWGAAGWAYTITAQDTVTSTDIVPADYPLFTNYDGINRKFGSITQASLWRYAGTFQGKADTIQIMSNKALSIPSVDNVRFSEVTVTGWSLKSWKASADGNPYASSLPVPVGIGSDIKKEQLYLADLGSGDPVIKSGGKTKTPGVGKVSVPGDSTQPATPKAGPPSNQSFGTCWDPIPSRNPGSGEEGLTGAVDLTFLVFDSKADANAVMKILNQPFGVS